MKRLLMFLAVLCTGMPLMALDLTQATIVYAEGDAPLVKHMAYGVLHVSEAIGVNPWYWFADVPIDVTNISHRDNSFTKKKR